MWAFTLYVYTRLPNIVVTHWNSAGRADAHGGKASIFAVTGVLTLIAVLLLWLSGRPHIYNYPVTITPQNRQRQYNNAALLMCVLSISNAVLGMALVYATYAAALYGTSLPVWAIVLMLAVVFVPVVVFMVRTFAIK